MTYKKILANLDDTKLLCCRNECDCEKARILIPDLSTLFRDSEIRGLFRPLNNFFERKIRALYLGANFEDNGDLFKKILKCSTNVRNQAEFAVRVTEEPDFMTIPTRYETGMLVARIFAGTGFDTSQLEPDVISDAITAISIDCFAGVSQTRLIERDKTPHPLKDEGADAVEIGILAVLKFLSAANLTETAFLRLIRRASRGPYQSFATNENAYHKVPKCWPSVQGWDDRFHQMDGVEVRPLLNIQDLRNEGRVMDNCLAHGTYDRDALYGHLAFFSMIAGDTRATLSFRLSTCQDENGQCIAETYEIDEIKGPENAPASPAYQDAAVALLKTLNATLPRSLDKNEIARQKILDVCFQSRRDSFCNDLQLAEQYWRRVYLPTLPSRLRHFGLDEIVDRIQDYGQ